MAGSMQLGNTGGEDVGSLVNILNSMSWEQRFWASWQALVEMESRYEKMLAQAGTLKPSHLNKKLDFKPKLVEARIMAQQRRREEGLCRAG